MTRGAAQLLGRIGPTVRRAAWVVAACLTGPVATSWASGGGEPSPGSAAALPAAGAGMTPPAVVSPGGMLLRVALGLALVLGLLGGVLWLYRKATHGRPSLRGDASIEILSQRALGPRTNLIVARVAGELLLLGVTQQQVNTLARLGEPGPGAQPALRDSETAARPVRASGPGTMPAPAQDAADVESLIGPAGPRGLATDFESALAGELQRVKQGMWTSLRRLEVSDK